jgi:hypothetical protein
MAELVVAHWSGVVELRFVAFALVGVHVHPPGLFIRFEHDFFKTEQAFLGSCILTWHMSS